MNWSGEILPGLLGVAVLVALAAAVLHGARTPHPWAPALAVLRGAAQLAAISLVLSGVITSRLWVACALLVMFTVAVLTATRRLGWSPSHLRWVALAMAAGVLVTLTIIFVSGAIDLTARYLLAVGGIVVGNTMSIATLAGRGFAASVRDRWEEVEGWLALGATPRQATVPMVRESTYAALVPSTDQTRTTGLVTLPGAFVGAIFGGVSPLEAGRFQIVVLAAIMAAGSVTAVVLLHGLAPVRYKPDALA